MFLFKQKSKFASVFDKLAKRKHRRTVFTVLYATSVIILSRLCRFERARADFFCSDVLGHTIQNLVANFCKLAQVVAKDFTVRRLCKENRARIEPVLQRLRRAVASRVSTIKIVYAINSLRACSACALARLAESVFQAIFFFEFVIGAHKFEADFFFVLFCQPHAKTHFEIVVARHFVVKSEALRAVPDKPDGNAVLIIDKLVRNHLYADFRIKLSCLFDSLHMTQSPFYNRIIAI